MFIFFIEEGSDENGYVYVCKLLTVDRKSWMDSSRMKLRASLLQPCLRNGLGGFLYFRPSLAKARLKLGLMHRNILGSKHDADLGLLDVP